LAATGDFGHYPPMELRMRLALTNLIRLLLLSLLLLAGCKQTDRKLNFEAQLKGKVPTSAKLLHAGAQYAGIDSSYGFVFNVEDDALLTELIARWKLNRKDSPSDSGFFRFAKHTWWPTDAEFSVLVPNFSHEYSELEEYWIVWPDNESGKLYVEHGQW
jgi:hypothetical protein